MFFVYWIFFALLVCVLIGMTIVFFSKLLQFLLYRLKSYDRTLDFLVIGNFLYFFVVGVFCGGSANLAKAVCSYLESSETRFVVYRLEQLVSQQYLMAFAGCFVLLYAAIFRESIVLSLFAQVCTQPRDNTTSMMFPENNQEIRNIQESF